MDKFQYFRKLCDSSYNPEEDKNKYVNMDEFQVTEDFFYKVMEHPEVEKVHNTYKVNEEINEDLEALKAGHGENWSIKFYVSGEEPVKWKLSSEARERISRKLVEDFNRSSEKKLLDALRVQHDTTKGISWNILMDKDILGRDVVYEVPSFKFKVDL